MSVFTEPTLNYFDKQVDGKFILIFESTLFGHWSVLVSIFNVKPLLVSNTSNNLTRIIIRCFLYKVIVQLLL
jgi:hypothetical protein